MGEKADRIFKTFVYDTDKGESCEKYDIVLSKFEQYFVRNAMLYTNGQYSMPEYSLTLRQ